MNYQLGIAAVVTVVSLCGCAHIRLDSMTDGKVLLAVSDDDIKHLTSRLGFTNVVCYGPGRDFKGERLLLELWTGQGMKPTKRCLVVVTADGAHAGPWRRDDEKVREDEEAGIPQNPPWDVWANWEPALPADNWIASVSGD